MSFAMNLFSNISTYSCLVSPSLNGCNCPKIPAIVQQRSVCVFFVLFLFVCLFFLFFSSSSSSSLGCGGGNSQKNVSFIAGLEL